MEARLQSSILVNALQRRAESGGGFAAILAKGDPTSGAVMVILAERGRKVRILERLLERGECYVWRDVGQQALANEAELEKFLGKRRKFDPDIWLIELDVVSAERFAAEMNSEV
ncbi:MAG: hypothetical protein AVDCRST_MAG23-2368 [uncultured Sphingosinicella sp.]|uniref:DUF1491 family protein n=1 Tax=uncultured Sphingosinicella sp. TaxID=478748 RepID=A0A6J4UBU9_9SPHN|nr:DUF1491 family protein [uncultured Sphingosinicella sp.]CAA9544116.1 MAG: hypothetical protein AVDCRST_MAG23-2368 [uncultured Sphingosinicella sp.]